MTLVAIGKFALVAELVDLAHVVEEGAHQEQVAIDLRIARADPQHDLHKVDDVFQQAAQIGMMVLHAGRGPGELGHEGLVQQETLGQGLQGRLGQAAEDLAQPEHELVDLDGPQGGEVVGIDLVAGNLGQPRDDQLHGALEQLRRALRADVVAVLEGLVDRLRGVPHARPDLAGPIGEFHLQVKVAVAIGTQLLLGDHENLVDGILGTQLIDVLARHREPFRRGFR